MPHPRWRARLLRSFGATIGSGVRVHRGLLLNAEHGFSRLRIDDGVYVGPNATLDLYGPLLIGARSTISTGAILLTHSDAGASHGNALLQSMPPTRQGLVIGEDCWIGAGSILLDGCDLGEKTVVGAGSVVARPLRGGAVYAGSPAKRIRDLPK